MKPISLNQARKARTKAAAKTKADENTVRFGRTKAEKALDAARTVKADAQLAQHKRDPE